MTAPLTSTSPRASAAVSGSDHRLVVPCVVRGAWLEKQLVWVFEHGTELRLVTDRDLKVWITLHSNLPTHDRPNDGIIRKKHTDLYAAKALGWHNDQAHGTAGGDNSTQTP